MIKLLKVKDRPETTSMLGNSKHTGIKTSTTRRWFYHSLSKQLIHFLLDNGMMSCSCLKFEALEIMDQGSMGTKLKMVTPNHIKHKHVGSNGPSLIQKMGKHTHCLLEEKEVDEAVDCNASRMLTPTAPLLPIISRIGIGTTTSRLPSEAALLKGHH